MKKFIIKLANNFLKNNSDLACDYLMELFKEKYKDKIFLIDQIESAKNKNEEILLSNGIILDFNDYKIYRIDHE